MGLSKLLDDWLPARLSAVSLLTRLSDDWLLVRLSDDWLLAGY